MAPEVPGPYAAGQREVDALVQQFFAELGRAIAKWQQVEFGLFQVFSVVSGCADGKIASAIFYSVIGFKDKLKMTDNAARLALAKDAFEKKWRPLRKRCLNASEVRNAFAHFWVMQGADTREGAQISLRPNVFDENELHKERKEEFMEFDCKKIARNWRVFSQLHIDLSAFLAGIEKPGAPPSEAP